MSTDTMRAAVWHAARDLRVETVPRPRTSDPHGVLVKVAACGICGSDLHEYAAGPIFIPVDAPHPISGDRAPIVMGHECAGEVVEVGDKVTRVTPADRVAIEPRRDSRFRDVCDDLTRQVPVGLHRLGALASITGRSEPTMRIGHCIANQRLLYR